MFFVHYFLHTFTNAAILMIIAISVLNFSVKFLVTKHTQIIYFSYNVFKQPKSFLKKVSSKPKVLQMFLQIRSRRERDLLRLRKSIGIALCFLKKKQSKRYIAYSDVVRITGFIFTILSLFYCSLKSFKTLLFKPFSALLTYFVIRIKFVQISCKRVKNVYKNRYINAP